MIQIKTSWNLSLKSWNSQPWLNLNIKKTIIKYFHFMRTYFEVWGVWDILNDHRRSERGDDPNTISKEFEQSSQSEVGPVASAITLPQVDWRTFWPSYLLKWPVFLSVFYDCWILPLNSWPNNYHIDNKIKLKLLKSKIVLLIIVI